MQKVRKVLFWPQIKNDNVVRNINFIQTENKINFSIQLKNI